MAGTRKTDVLIRNSLGSPHSKKLDVSDRNRGHYVNNKEFYALMCTYIGARKAAKLAQREYPHAPDRVGQCILLICERLSLRPNFMNYSYRDEMISDAIENCVMAIGSFDPTRSNNPFAYFTRVAFNAFIRRIEREKKQTYIKFKNGAHLEDMASDIQRQEIESLYDPGPSVNSGRSRQLTQSVRDEVITKFETRLVTKKRTKAKVKKPRGVEKFAD